jgi:hypothetical protein
VRAGAKLLHGVSEQGQVPFVAIHSTESSPLTKDFKASAYPGLLFCHSVKSGKEWRLFSYWRDRQFFDIHAIDFQSMIAAGAGSTIEGVIADYAREKEDWWKRFPFWTVIITTSALIGAFTALWQSGAQLLERPDITVSFSPSNPPNVLNTDVQNLKFSVTNQCRFASAEVKIKAVLAPSGTPENQVVYPHETARLSKIEAGKKEEFELRASSTPIPVTGEGPTPYELRLWVNSSAGLLRWSRWFSRSSPAIAVWKAVDWTRPKIERSPPGKCSFSGSLYSGIKQNLRAVIKVPAPVVIRSLVTIFDGNSFANGITPTASGKGAKQEIDLAGLQAFRPRPYDYGIVVQGDGLDQGACQEMLSPDHLTIEFLPRTGGQQ